MSKEFTKKEYSKYVENVSPRSKTLRDTFRAFWVGGFICVIGQLLMFLYKDTAGLEEKTAAAAVSITLIFTSIVLSGFNLYDDIGKYAGAGSAIPITGFANSIVSPAMEFKSEGLVLGLGAKMFVIAGPVLVYGTVAAVVVGILHFLFK